jgi:hypothetical protein
MSKYKGITFKATASNCPICGAYAQIDWQPTYIERYGGFAHAKGLSIASCSHCYQFSIWLDEKMLFPPTGNVPLPNVDMPQDVAEDYQEAAAILNTSPRGAAALLRLGIQKLCKALGESGDNINSDIKNLVSKGLQPIMQQALDSVRVVGNNAVHPGQIDLKDDGDTALKLFGFINIIVTTLITQPKQIAEFYDNVIPEDSKAAIAKRDMPKA